MTNAPDRYRTKPTEVTAVRFDGFHGSVEKLLQHGAMVSLVPRGYDDKLRYEREYDRSRVDVLEDAPAFLVLFTTQGRVRVDRDDWVVSSEGSGRPWREVPRAKFASDYEAVEVSS